MTKWKAIAVFAAVAAPAMLAAQTFAADDFDRAVAALRAVATATTVRQASNAAALLDTLGARAVAGVDPALAWRGRPTTAAYRERVLGPGYLSVAIESGKSYRLEQSFLAGKRARVAAFSTDSAAFDLSVRDEDGVRRCAEIRGNARCDWVPIYTSRVSIALENRDRQRATYFVMMQ